MTDPVPSHPLFIEPVNTLEQLIRTGADWLDSYPLSYGHGTDNPLDESAWIALEACDLSPLEPLDDYAIPVRQAHLDRAREWYRRRAEENIPVAYLTGRCWFAGLEFATDPRALIPRSPIAELIASRFEPWLASPPLLILDLCCGGGCIGIATAVEFPQAVVHCADLSSEALELARTNRDHHGLQQRVELYQGDLFKPLPAGAQYDLIVSNPPYVDQRDLQQMGGEFHHEPRLGLAAGADGLDIAHIILEQAATHLKPDGVLIVEVGNSAPALEQHYSKLEFVWLDFAAGGQGVFLLTAQQLRAAFAPG